MGMMISRSRCEKMILQLIERSAPSFLMAATALFVKQPRMGEGQLCALGNGTKVERDPRLAGVFCSAKPSPAHHQTFRPHDLDIFAAAFMFAGIELAEAHPE